MLRYLQLNNWRYFIRDYFHFKKLTSKSAQRFTFDREDLYPCLGDKTSSTSFDRHYVYHIAWAARILAATKPEVHVDISSSLYFCAVISAFMPVRFYDIRPANIQLSQLSTEHANLLSLPFDDYSVQSLSCMHVVEHVGLGRYGDPLDPDGDLKAIGEIQRVLAKGGSLLFVVPIGQAKIMFNAHRIYSYEQILSYFDLSELVEFTLISDNSSNTPIIYNADKNLADNEQYGCGCFLFKRF